MKIRNRLFLCLTLLSAGAFLLVGLLVYIGSATSQKQHFFVGPLTDEDQYPFGKASEVALKERKTFIFSLNNKKAAEDSLKALYPLGFVEELFGEGYAEFQANGKQGVGELIQQEGETLVVLVVAPDSHWSGWRNYLAKLLIAGFLLSVLLCYFFSRLATGYILKPIAEAIQKALQISATNLHLRLKVDNEKDILGQLALAFNDMLARLETSFEMQKNFISNASHEIRNPLTAIIGEAEVCLERRRKPEEYIESLQNISREAERLEALLKSLLQLAHTGFGEAGGGLEDTRLDEVLLEARGMAAKVYPGTRVKVDFSALPENPSWITIQANPNLLRIAFSNLIENACKFSTGQEEVLVKLSASEKSIQLQVIDKGVGIPPQELKNILQPFYRARNARSFKGFGIGLSLTDKIIRLHKGQLNIISEEGVGTTMEVGFNKF